MNEIQVPGIKRTGNSNNCILLIDSANFMIDAAKSAATLNLFNPIEVEVSKRNATLIKDIEIIRNFKVKKISQLILSVIQVRNQSILDFIKHHMV